MFFKFIVLLKHLNVNRSVQYGEQDEVFWSIKQTLFTLHLQGEVSSKSLWSHILFYFIA